MTPSTVLVDTFTPIFDAIVQDVGLVGASVYGRIWRYCQGNRHCCDAAQFTIAGQLNLSLRTVQRWIAELVQAGYLEDLTPDLKNKPHSYTTTGKLRLVVNIRAECATTESRSATTESRSHYDRESHEETSKQTSKRQGKRDSGASAPGNPAQQRLERTRARLGADPFSVAASCKRAQDDAGGEVWTVPVEAGGTDRTGALMLDAWLATKGVDPAVVPKPVQDEFRATLSKLAATLEGIAPEQAAIAVEIVLDRDNPEFAYYTYTDPAVAKFKRDWTDVALRLLSGQPGYLTARDPTDKGQPKGLAALRLALKREGVLQGEQQCYPHET